jgi:hypothetical protein
MPASPDGGPGPTRGQVRIESLTKAGKPWRLRSLCGQYRWDATVRPLGVERVVVPTAQVEAVPTWAELSQRAEAPAAQRSEHQQFRRELAAEVLLVLVERGDGSVYAAHRAVEYADALLAELERPRG